MKRTLAVRVAATIPTIIGVAVVVFFVVHLIPGDPVKAMLGERATPGQVEAVRTQLGLNEPLLIQFWDFVRGYATGDFGTSLAARSSVAGEIYARLGPTVSLAVSGVVLSVLLGVPLGIYGATRRGSKADVASQIASTIGVATPSFWLGLLLALVFSVKLDWLPSIGAGRPGDPLSAIRALILPSLALALPGMALVARMTRSSMLDVLSEDYIRTARAKGVSDTLVLFKHALRNAAIPILTVVSLSFGYLLGGTIVVETVFARPGLGKLLLDAILARDYPVVQGVCFFIAVAFVLVNLITDVLYVFIDPRAKSA